MKKEAKMNIKVLLIVLLFSLLIAACAPAEEMPKTSGEVMKVATNYWPGKFWINIADKKGWFEEAGLNVKLVSTFDDYYGSIQDTADGKNDINGMSLFDVISFNAKGAEFVAIINTDNSASSDALVVRKDIQNFNGLRNKKIAVSEGFYTDYMLDVILEKNGVTEEDITKVDGIPDEEMADAFIAGKIDGFLSWQPQVSIAIKNGGQSLWDASLTPGISPNVHAVRKSFIRERPEDVQAYANVWHKTTEWMKNNLEESFQIISIEYGFPTEDVKELYESEVLPDLRDNKIAFSYAAGFESLHGTARQINDFMIKKGITDKQLDSTEFIDARFIRNAE
jgi:NitT/TauT family transport system substrate-binding protein